MKKPTATHVIAALALFLVGIVIIQSLNLRNQATSPDTAALLDRLEILAEQQDSLRLDLDAVAGADFVTIVRYETDQQALNETLKASTATPQADWQQLRDDLTAIATQADRLQQELAGLQESLTRSPVPATRPAPPKQPAHKPKPQAPPFDAIGLEYRGGEAFLAISPLQNTNLSHVQLLHPGDSHQGWQLQSLEAGTARFLLPDGSQRSLAIQ